MLKYTISGCLYSIWVTIPIFIKIDHTRYPTGFFNKEQKGVQKIKQQKKDIVPLMLLSGLTRFMVETNPNTPNFLDDKNTSFAGLHGM